LEKEKELLLELM
jgi:hypothetical protein